VAAFQDAAALHQRFEGMVGGKGLDLSCKVTLSLTLTHDLGATERAASVVALFLQPGQHALLAQDVQAP
jgi:hypothetical protein